MDSEVLVGKEGGVWDDERTLAWKFVAHNTIWSSSKEERDRFPIPLVCIIVRMRRLFYQSDSEENFDFLENIDGYDDDTFRRQNHKTYYFVRMGHLLFTEKRGEIMDNLLLALPLADDDIPVLKESFSSFVEKHLSAFRQKDQPLATFAASITYAIFKSGIVTDIMWDKHKLEIMRAEMMKELFEKQQKERHKYMGDNLWIPMPLGDSLHSVRKVAKKFSSSSLPSSSEGFTTKKFVWGRRCKSICHICLEGYVFKSSQVARLPCRHIFHEDCITQWIGTKKTCPVCRHRV